MTFEQTMHTIESHLEALQAEYDNLYKKYEESVQANKDLGHWLSVNKPYEDMKVRYARLLEENNQLKEQNANLLKFKKANTPMYKGEYNAN